MISHKLWPASVIKQVRQAVCEKAVSYIVLTFLFQNTEEVSQKYNFNTSTASKSGSKLYKEASIYYQ